MRETNETKGIDVSLWQGDIDWRKVKASGITFAMIKSSQGNTTTYDRPFVDPKFIENVNGALAAGLKVGVYHYLCSSDEQMLAREMQFFIGIISPYRGKMMYAAVDVEDDRTLGRLSNAVLTSYVKKFCDTVKAAGHSPLVYANSYWLSSRFVTSYPVWEANWSAGTKPVRDNLVMWQYSSNAIVDGVDGNVDINYGYFKKGDANIDGKIDAKDATSILKYLAKWDITIDLTNADVNGDGVVNVQDVSELLKRLASWGVNAGTVYSVKVGDTLSKIAMSTASTVTEIVEANRSNYPEITSSYIQAGWSLTIPK